MTFPWLNNIILGNNYVGIEHYFLNDEHFIAIVQIEKKNENLYIVIKDRVSYSGKLSEKWKKNLPFFLVINTTQVVHKEIDTIDPLDEKLLYKAFPNTDWEDFYFEIYRMETKSIIAISRKSYVEQLLLDYQKQGINIAGVSLGMCSISETVKFIDTGEINTNIQQLSWNRETPVISPLISDEQVVYNINNLSIQNNHVLAFSGVLKFVLFNSENTGNIINYSDQLLDTYQQSSFFSKGLKTAIGMILGILVINFIAFSYYFQQSESLTERILVSKFSQESIQKVKARIQIKEQKVKNILEMESSQTSRYVNDIVKKIPSSILLSELNYSPLQKKIQEEELIVFQKKIITVSGSTLNSAAFSEWIENIEKLNWIDEVIITSFGKSESNETLFSLKIHLK